jgi:micrococcal nuclease
MRAVLVFAVMLAGSGGLRPPLARAASDDDLTGVVIHADDGQTLQIRPDGGGPILFVRLIGLEAPRKATRDLTGQEPWGTRAQQSLSLKVTRKTVRVEYDVVRPASSDGKTRWAYVWLGDTLVNEMVLRSGNAVLDTRAPNVKYVERLQAAATEAREKGRGVWDAAAPLPEPPGKFVARKQAAEAERKETEVSVALAKFEPGCVIGNTKSKKYHLPGGRYYESSKDSKNAVFFLNAEDARAAGYTPAAR